jgi:hypothetical protein
MRNSIHPMGRAPLEVRAWDGEEMVYPTKMALGESPHTLITPGAILDRFNEVMPYTWKNDKNGNPLWVGDVVLISDDAYVIELCQLQGMFVLKNLHKSTHGSLGFSLQFYAAKCEKIGHIYETKFKEAYEQ